MIKTLLFLSLLSWNLLAKADSTENLYSMLRGHKLNQLSKELSLSDDQKSELEDILKEQSDKIRAIHESAHKKIMSVLNADQLAKWETIVKQRRENQLKRLEEEAK